MLIYFILILFYLFYLFKSLNIGSVCCMEGVESGFHFHINYMKAECILKKILRPVLYTNKSVTLKDLLGDDETRLGSTFRVREASPLQHAGRGNQTSAGSGARELPGLPPVCVRLVDHFQQLSSAERHPCIGTGDGGVLQGEIVHQCSHIYLTHTKRGRLTEISQVQTSLFTIFSIQVYMRC